MEEKEKFVDESWKDSVEIEKEKVGDIGESEPSSPEAASGEYMQFDFLNYISSLAFQAMIFLGELPNPITNQTDKNLQQAKLIIDTLVILKEKTKGNLTKQEDDMLTASLYELQMRFVELVSQEEKSS